MNTRIAKTLLVAAALVGATASPAKAYVFTPNWSVTQPSDGDSAFVLVGQDFAGTFWGNFNTRLVDAGVYRNAIGKFEWQDNYYDDGDWDLARGALGMRSSTSGFVYGSPTAGFEFQTPEQEGFYVAGYYLFNTETGTTNVSIRQLVGQYGLTLGDYDTDVKRTITLYERNVQVARTGSGANGANAFSAFQGDNSYTLSGPFYNASFAARNVLDIATDGEGDLAGSYIRVGDISLGFGGAEGLFAKDGGWLDIRGDLTLGASGTIYIRDAEITANVYTQYYTPGTLDTLGVLTIDSGILSVRSHFAQDMVANWEQTLGLRDGAENNSRLYLNGYGYGFDGEGFGDVSFGGGALRSISGENIQNGNISIVGDGEGFLDGAVIGTDLGSKLTINGNINGLNSFGSNGGDNVVFNSVGNTVANGSILGGIRDVIKYGDGELVLAAANTFTGKVDVHQGSVRVTHAGALSLNDGEGSSATYVDSGASLVLDHATGLSLADDIHIIGAGKTGVGGAIHNKSGANATTGNLWIDSVGGGDASATATVAASSSLTVANLRTNGSYDTFTVDVSGADTTAGAFTVLGNTGSLDKLVKNGTGVATFTTLTNDVDTIIVNAGKAIILGSDATVESPYNTAFDKDGAGLLEVRGTYVYRGYDVFDGTVDIFGNVSLDGSLGDGDFDVGRRDIDPLLDTSATINVQSGGVLTHISPSDGEGGFYNDDFDLVNASKLDVKLGGTVNLNETRLDLEDTSSLVVAGVVNTDNEIEADDESTIEVLSGGVINADIQTADDAKLFLRTGGTINGNVTTYDDSEYLIESGATHNGDYNAYGSADIVVNGTIGFGTALTGNVFDLSGSARLSGSGVLTGNLTQTNGTVAPGNSTDVLTVLGNYAISAGKLEIEIGGTAGAGVDPNGNDQLAVGGTVTVSGTAILDFQPYNGFESTRGDVFQVLSTVAGAPRATIGTFNTVEMTGLNDRVLFDHSTGKAYGTGLALPNNLLAATDPGYRGQTFADYGDNGNRREIGRALWMESIVRDNSATQDRNFESQGIEESDLALPVTDPDTESLGLKAFIFTQPADEIDETQVGTDLGAAAVSVLTAGDVGAALDALSPEAYVGFTELNTRLNRNFSLLGSTGRRSGDEKKWGFNLGYSGEQLTSNGSSDYTQFKAGSNTAYLTADLALSAQTHLNLSLGIDDGDVRAREFDGDTDSALAGIGISVTTSEAFARFDLGAAFSSTDITAVRQGGVANLDGQDGYAVSLRVTFLPKDPPLKPAVAGQPAETPRLSLSPYVGLSIGSSSLDSFVESESADTVQLGVAGYDRDSLVGEVGLGIEYVLGANTTLTGVLAYEHEFESSGETDLTAEFAEDGVTDTRFGVRSEGIGAGIFRVGLGLRQKIGAATSVGIGYDALMGSGIDSGHHLKADVSFRF